MVERLVGQLSLADGLVSPPPGSMLDELGAVLNWGPVRTLLGKRGEAGPGNSSYLQKYCCGACCSASGMACPTLRWR